MNRALCTLCLLGGLAPACVPGLVGSGTAASETRDLPDPFTGLEVRTVVDVEILSEPPADTARLTCDDNLLPHLTLTVVDGVLRVGTDLDRGLSPRTRCALELAHDGLTSIAMDGTGDLDAPGPHPALATLSLDGTGDALLRDLSAPDLTLTVDGTGDATLERLTSDTVDLLHDGTGAVILRGAVDRFTATLDGTGPLDAFSLSAREVVVTLSGTGDAAVTGTGSVTGTLSGTGDLTVAGGGTIDIDVTGTGELLFR